MAILPTSRRPGGLLGANPLTYAGLGMLSQGPSLTPINPMGGLTQGLMMGQQAQQAQAQSAYQNAQLEMQRQKMQQQQAAQQAADQAAAARAEALAKLGPEYQTLGALGAGPAANAYAKSLAPAAAPELPGSVREAQWYAQADPQARAAFEAAQAAGSARNTFHLGPQGFDPQTQSGKAFVDLTNLEKLPQSPERDAAIDAARAQLAKATQPTAEVAERESKYASALDAAERFTELAGQNEGAVGPLEGRMTGLGISLGRGSEIQGELSALEATAKSRLGTALSGAAIPASEWHVYMAQIPALTDSPAVRKGKMKALRETMDALEEMKLQRVGQQGSPLAETPDAPGAPLLQSSAGVDAPEADIMAAYGLAP